MEISITRALTELKTLDKRITKKISGSTFISFSGQFQQPNEYAKTAPAQYQSIQDLVRRRKDIKSRIIISNANTDVKICDTIMTVAEAIETKSSIKHQKNLLAQMKQQYGNMNLTVERANENVRRDLENKTSRGTDKEVLGGESLIGFSEKYMKMHGVSLYDPLGLGKKIEDLENYITEFDNQIDYILSESNARTMIIIPE